MDIFNTDCNDYRSLLSGKVLCVPPASSDARVLSQKMEEMRPDVFKNIKKKPLKYRLDLWDFGGQQIYYTSHQTFLNERAIYVLTVDMSKALDGVISTEIEVPKWKESGSPKTSRGTWLFRW